ncbi:MAG: GDSL-type esterase/lipase family protein [Acidobacteriota bacterium]
MTDSDSPESSSVPAWLAGWRGKLILVGFSLLVCVLFLEVALRIVGVGAAVEDDGATTIAYHETLGWDLVPGSSERHITPEFDVEVAINEQGFRDGQIYPEARLDGVRRIVVIGDSFSFGHGVEEVESWPALLEAWMADTEVINLSVAGYGTDQQILRFDEHGASFEPDVVMLGLFIGDIFRNARTSHYGYAKPRFVLDDGAPRLVNVPVPEARIGPPLSRLWGMVGTRLWSIAEHRGMGEAWPVTAALLDHLAERCAELGAELVVVVIPKDGAITGSGWRKSLHLDSLDVTTTMLESGGHRFIDLTPALADAAETTELYFPQDGHWTAAGHRVAMAAILDDLQSTDTDG